MSRLSNTHLFYIGFFLKVVLATFFSSDVLTQLFVPFISWFVDSGFQNPYQHFSGLGQLTSFPYPALMLFLLSLPKVLCHSILHLPLPDILLARVPVFVADVGIFVVLLRWLPTFKRKILIFYWLSPVLIYINYLHGQLDMIPIAILFGSLYLLFKEKYRSALFVLGLAMATKFHILITLPFFIVYAWKKKIPLLNVLQSGIAFVLGFILINLPFMLEPSFFAMTLFNPESMKVFYLKAHFSDGHAFYIIVAAYFVCVLRSAKITFYNRNIFLMFMGFSFALLLFFIPPQPGWYVWIIPFFAYFHIKDRQLSGLTFFGLQAAYLVYFLISPESDYRFLLTNVMPSLMTAPTLYEWIALQGLDANKLHNIAFTLLQTTLLINGYWIYKKGLLNYVEQKLTSKPYLIGISGDSGAGKTTLADSLCQLFPSGYTQTIHGDDMHKWERGDDMWNVYTHLNPKANHLHDEHLFLSSLKKGKAVKRRYYDHGTGRFTDAKKIDPRNMVIFEGLHTFFIQRTRKLYDLKIFLKPEKQLLAHWKIVRDMAKRNHTKEAILEQLNKRKKDGEMFIESQANHADVFIEIKCKQPIINCGDPNEKIETYVSFTMPNTLQLDTLINALEAHPELTILHEYDDNDGQHLSIEGAPSSLSIADIAATQMTYLHEFDVVNPQWKAGQLGLMQLVITYIILEQQHHENNAN